MESVLLIHCDDDDETARIIVERLAIRGYEALGNVNLEIGRSIYGSFESKLSKFMPVLFLGTQRAAGNSEAKTKLNAARHRNCSVLPIRVDKQAALSELFPDMKFPCDYSEDPEAAIDAIVTWLDSHFDSVRDEFRRAESGFASLSADDVDSTKIASIVMTEGPIGKTEEIKQFRTLLQKGSMLLVYGFPGQGKTTVARATALSFNEEFEGRVCEIDLRNETTIEALPELIASSLGLPTGESAYQALRKQKCFVLLDGFDYLKRHHSDTELDKVLAPLIRSLTNGSKVIITCQERFSRTGMVTRSVEKLSKESCLTLFDKAADSDIYISCDRDTFCLLYTSPSPRDATLSRMPSSA